MADPPSVRFRAAHSFGVVSDRDAVRSALSGLCAELSERTGLIFFGHVVRSYAALLADVKQKRIDFAWAPPLVAAELIQQGVAEALVTSRREASSLFHSALFVHRDSGLVEVGDLEGKHIGWVDSASAAGYAVPRRWLRDRGCDLDSFFGRESFLGTHAAVARAVFERRVDVGATYAILDGGSRQTRDGGWNEVAIPDAGIHIVSLAGTVPADCVVGATELPPSSRAKVRSALVELGTGASPLVQKVFRTSGFEVANPGYTGALARLSVV
ncbi:MAG: phosphate/phosphite/phosphonate ABC transporter substrate-binding protein [Polyangiaceae bacterium]